MRYEIRALELGGIFWHHREVVADQIIHGLDLAHLLRLVHLHPLRITEERGGTRSATMPGPVANGASGQPEAGANGNAAGDTFFWTKRFTPRTCDRIGFELVWLRAFHEMYNPALGPAVVAEVIADYPGVRLTMIGPDKGDGSLERTRKSARALGISGSGDRSTTRVWARPSTAPSGMRAPIP